MIWLLIFLVLSVLQHIHATVFAVLVMESSAVSEELEHLLMIANLIQRRSYLYARYARAYKTP